MSAGSRGWKAIDYAYPLISETYAWYGMRTLFYNTRVIRIELWFYIVDVKHIVRVINHTYQMAVGSRHLCDDSSYCCKGIKYTITYNLQVALNRKTHLSAVNKKTRMLAINVPIPNRTVALLEQFQPLQLRNQRQRPTNVGLTED